MTRGELMNVGGSNWRENKLVGVANKSMYEKRKEENHDFSPLSLCSAGEKPGSLLKRTNTTLH